MTRAICFDKLQPMPLIAQTDSETGSRVFDLYGLTDEERRIVMGT